MSLEFEKYLLHSGITHKPGPSHFPELNGVAERANRSIRNTIQEALLSAQLPKSFWANALRHAVHTHNSYPCNTPREFKTPTSVLGVKAIDLTYLHPFGCLVYYKVPEALRKKLNQKG